MSEKKQLNEEKLEKVSGGINRYFEVGKYYCIANSDDVSNGFPLHVSLRFGPYDTFEEVKTKGSEWAVESYNKGNINIVYILGQQTENGWNKIEEIHHPQ